MKEWGTCVSPDGVPSMGCLLVITENLLFVSGVFALLILLFIVIFGSFQYVIAGGNADKLKKAKMTIFWGLVGLGLFLSSYLILTIIDQLFLGGKGILFKLDIPSF